MNPNVRNIGLLACLFFLLYPLQMAAQPIKTGAERMEIVTRLLEGKRVGLVVNQTSILEKPQIHLLDTLLGASIQVVKIFAPEHGFRGTADAGEEIQDSRDVKTGLPIISLYGNNKKPTAEQLAGLDVVVLTFRTWAPVFIPISVRCIT